MSNVLKTLKSNLHTLADPKKKQILQRFFKTAPGEYAEGDIFLGITVPNQRLIAKKYFREISLIDTEKLVKSKIHEERLTALFILNAKYQKAQEPEKSEIIKLYLENKAHINNWDLVDSSAPYILGDYLLDKDKATLYKLAKSTNLWDRRIAIMATFAFIKQHDFSNTLKIAEILIHDPHDLIHKAVGWMLREIGNRDKAVELNFLKSYADQMPRVMYRYAVEKFTPEEKSTLGEKITKTKSTTG
jgi:3-methyladenine DNA glycosylase AlkD